MRHYGSVAPVALVALVAAIGCGGGGSAMPTGASAVAAEVELDYGAVSSSEASSSAACSGVARVYPSWWGFTHATMIPTGPGQWAALFEDVPVGRQSFRLEPPIGCATARITANALPLTASDDGAFAFTVHSDGSVTH